MKHLLGILALSLLAAGGCLAQSGDAESETSRQQLQDAKRAAEEARIRAEAERERQQPRLQQPIYRYPPTPSALLEQAVELERIGKGPEAVKMYMRAAREGSGKAALRLAYIYDKGIPGVMRDYAEQLKWEHVARVLGEDVSAKKP